MLLGKVQLASVCVAPVCMLGALGSWGPLEPSPSESSSPSELESFMAWEILKPDCLLPLRLLRGRLLTRPVGGSCCCCCCCFMVVAIQRRRKATSLAVLRCR